MPDLVYVRSCTIYYFNFIFPFFIFIFLFPCVLPPQIVNESVTWNAHSKVGSLDNMDHKPGGGNIHVRTVCLSICLCALTPTVCLFQIKLLCTFVSGFGFFLFLFIYLFVLFYSAVNCLVIVFSWVHNQHNCTFILSFLVLCLTRSMVYGCYLTSLTNGGVNADDSVCELILFFIFINKQIKPSKKNNF